MNKPTGEHSLEAKNMVKSLVITVLTLRYFLSSALDRNGKCVCVCVFPSAEPSPHTSQRQWSYGSIRGIVEEGTFILQKKEFKANHCSYLCKHFCQVGGSGNQGMKLQRLSK